MFLNEREGPEKEDFTGVETGFFSGFFSTETGLLYRSKLLSIPIEEGWLSFSLDFGSESLELESESLELESESLELDDENEAFLAVGLVVSLLASGRALAVFDS